jgi:hydrogenase expression/formation protein HypD
MIRYIDEFRNKAAALAIGAEIRSLLPKKKVAFMEICGGHTLTALKYGLHDLFPKGLELKSGPGCPVCVTAQDFIDTAIALSRRPKTIIATFGDMLRVPGSETSLLKEKAGGCDIRISLSPLDAVQIAHHNPDSEVVFLGIGFETTTPTIGMAIIEAEERSVKNFSVLCALKTMPAAMRGLLENHELALDGFICPGHVSAVAGTRMYEPIVSEFHVPCVVSGFEPTDMLTSIVMLLRQVAEGRHAVENQYTRVVQREGNRTALEVIAEVFEPGDAFWRGLGNIPSSGLSIRRQYALYNAAARFSVKIPPARENQNCICGDVMRGVKKPSQCRLFRKVCNPENPIGACMVSAEGACGIYYKYYKK